MFCSVLLGEGADQSGRSAVNSSIQSWSIFTCPYRNCSVIKEQQRLKFNFFLECLMVTGHVQLSRETPKHLPSRAPEKKKNHFYYYYFISFTICPIG